MEIKYELYRLKPEDSNMLKREWEVDNIVPDRYEKIRRDVVVIETKSGNAYYVLQQMYRVFNKPDTRQTERIIVSDIVVLNPGTNEEAFYYCNGLNFCRLDNFHPERKPEKFTFYGYDNPVHKKIFQDYRGSCQRCGEWGAP